MNKDNQIVGCVTLLLLWSCLRCTSQIESTTNVTQSYSGTPVITASTPLSTEFTEINEDSTPCLRRAFQPKPTINATRFYKDAVYVTKATLSPTPEITKSGELTTSTLASTPTPILVSALSESDYTPGDLAELLPNGTETQIYMLTTTALTLSSEQTMQKLWRYALVNGTYDLVTSWSVFSERSLVDNVPVKVQPTIAAYMSVSQDELSDLKEQFDPLGISLSPNGRYLAVGVSTFACCFDYIPSWPIKNSIFRERHTLGTSS